MDIVINLDSIVALFDQPADVLAARFFLYAGWIPFAWLLLWMAWVLWIKYIQTVYNSKREYILLALDVPAGNEQSPAAVEKLFAHLAGAHKTRNLLEDYWEGVTQDTFSFEIVSIEGYTQYVIRTMPQYRDLIEAVVYAEYPDAEITEVDDYVTEMPDRFPDERYDLYGGEWILFNSDYYPIRTYLDFEHQLSGEFKDPLAALLELFGSLRKGEQCWYQLVLTPVGQDFPKGADDEINKVIGYNPPGKKSKDIVDIFLNPLLKILSGLADFIIPGTTGEEEQKEEEQKIDMLNLKPLQKKAIEAIQQKVSKLVYEVKLRFVYVAEKEAVSKARINSFVGVMKQFSVEDLNALKPDLNVTFITASYFWQERRRNARRTRLTQAYKARSNWVGRLGYMLNIEELATIWHFPVEPAVKTAMLQKVPSRKSDAPSYLPVEGATIAAAGEHELQRDLEIGSAPVAPPAAAEATYFNEPVSAPAAVPAASVGPPDNLPIA